MGADRGRTKWGHLVESPDNHPEESTTANSETDESEPDGDIPITLDKQIVVVTDSSDDREDRYRVRVVHSDAEWSPVVSHATHDHRLAPSRTWDRVGMCDWDELPLLVRHRVAAAVAGVDEPADLDPTKYGFSRVSGE
ncbi:hypothetical protein SAMN05216388_100947 [Halorientalis persicus]|uniref:Uncharacterized protein n=1 Tax=Halorientalis persicus TaxID=1367881 RepID=A0A1H8MML2_9EURY|nr:hypothetical protein [Halorientalis persicus]SEO18366.1 hypothetical protein SAMN05216388_100947 [Halorientalis persicus]